MLCNSASNRGFKSAPLLCSTLFLFYLLIVQLSTTSGYSIDYSRATTMSPDDATNSSAADDLYVIKAVVYEIGILTDADNTTDETTERQEVKLSFYNPPSKDNGP